MSPRSVKYRQASHLAQRRIAGELFVVDPRHRCLHQPQGAGDPLWEWLKKGATVEELVQNLLRDYDVPRDTAEKDVRRFLRELKRKKIVEEVS
ncbi:MAG TPA: PqqD family protein [Elusimicrobiota bacterium]|nr:PqqD family protein [Elusimicrobiota bacterium]